jgi:hypothetical protein
MSNGNDPERNKNLGTAIALAGLTLAALALLGIMSMVIPDIIKILLVFLGLIGIGLIQYVVWGWSIVRNRIRDDEEEFWNKPRRR